MSPDNPAVNIGVLQVAHSIFKRWRPLFQSNELYTEINHVLNKFGNPFLALFEVLSLRVQWRGLFANDAAGFGYISRTKQNQ